jgi:hypothetical protein
MGSADRQASSRAGGLLRAGVSQNAVINFLELLIRSETKTGYRIRWATKLVVGKLRDLLERPTKGDAEAFSLHGPSIEHVEREDVPLVMKSLSVRKLLTKEQLGFWPKGSLVAADTDHCCQQCP